MSRDEIQKVIFQLEKFESDLYSEFSIEYGDDEELSEALSIMRNELDKPFPEPVAWMKNIGEMDVADVTSSIWTAQEWSCIGIDVVPLYAEPPARKELTQSALIEEFKGQSQVRDDLGENSLVAFIVGARFAERKHGITDTEQSKPQSNAI